MKGRPLHLSKKQINAIGIAAVIAVAVATVYLFAPGTVIGKPSISAMLLQPKPINPSTGQLENVVMLIINYTGAGYGNYTYIMTYSQGGTVHTFSQNIRVSHLSAFTSYLYLSGNVSSVNISVYKGSNLSSSSLIYSKTVEIS
ncbi:MAG: hypothetical protein QXV32_06630 [Conexivisphaerales archaeon]